jgi:methylphosphotriester-DNA--protein-cysteine methyltransferase
MDLDHDACYRAIELRDARFDGRFFTAVKTTSFYLICDQALDASSDSVETEADRSAKVRNGSITASSTCLTPST